MTEQIDPVLDMAGETVLTTGVGTLLRQAREARGLKVEEIAQMLKLGIRQIEAIEAERWETLPGATIVRGFVRNYARLVQIDATPLMAQLDKVLAKPMDTLAVPETRPEKVTTTTISGSRRDRTVVIAGLVLVLLAVLAYLLVPNDLSALRENTQSLLDSLSRKEAPKPAETADTPATLPAASAPEAAAPVSSPAPGEPVFPPGTTPQQIMNPQAVPANDVTPAVQPGGGPVDNAPAATRETQVPTNSAPQLRFVFDKDSWLEVRDRDNKVLFSQRLGAGTEQTVAGNGPLSLVIGYAPGVRLFWRGQAVDLVPHTRGDVARLVLE